MVAAEIYIPGLFPSITIAASNHPLLKSSLLPNFSKNELLLNCDKEAPDIVLSLTMEQYLTRNGFFDFWSKLSSTKDMHDFWL